MGSNTQTPGMLLTRLLQLLCARASPAGMLRPRCHLHPARAAKIGAHKPAQSHSSGKIAIFPNWVLLRGYLFTRPPEVQGS
ncbi:hypothetical protein COO60DRAFT_738462 [Scenedesmus sp. NREL 46B-D3]|nr:hypothetical protein COO60DRAFT_738462 [Scenedesmus sp. NREL 46B-D3]